MPLRSRLLVLLTLVLAGCDFGASGRSTEMADFERAQREGDGASAAEAGATRFVFDDFQGLSTDTLESSAVPWKVAATVLVLHQRPGEAPTQAALLAQLQRYGLFVPTSVANWPTAGSPAFTRPMGLVSGPVGRRFPAFELEVATIGCASCHAGALYDADGMPTREAWLGQPNTSLDLDAYADAVLAGLRAHRDRRDEVMAAIPLLFPGTSERELKSLRRFVWPRLAKRLDELAGADALPFRNGGPGRSNGIDALRLRLGVPVHAAGDAAEEEALALVAERRDDELARVLAEHQAIAADRGDTDRHPRRRRAHCRRGRVARLLGEGGRERGGKQQEAGETGHGASSGHVGRRAATGGFKLRAPADIVGTVPGIRAATAPRRDA